MTTNDTGSLEIVDGGQGELIFSDPKRVRGDAKLVSTMLSCGVIPPEQVETLIRGAVILGAKAIQQQKTREWAAVMRVLIAAANLQIQRESGPLVAIQNNLGENARALDQKRELQIERERFELQKLKGEWVALETVNTIVDKISSTMREIVEIAKNASEELADDIRGKLLLLEADINRHFENT